MKKLPIGIQTFSEIREENYVYIDKTEIAHNLIKNGKYYFLSRPRRFGKSLFLDTLHALFEARKVLFEGLYIYDKWDWSVKYPVVRISFGAGVAKSKKELDLTIQEFIEDNERELKLECEDSSLHKKCLRELIREAYEKYHQKVVVLVDEYDKPILDNITDKKTAKEMRDTLKNLYSVIKDSDRYIKFVFITGVSKFSKVNLFSGLNNLQDITINEDYATICGYTHEDLKIHFKEHLEGANLDRVKEWYNGYNYLGERVYNPFDILLFISNSKGFRSYWWSTGNPGFLIELLETKEYYIPNVENYEATDAILDSFDVDCIELEALLWQTGYLTIDKQIVDERDRIKYSLKVPNLEIQFSLNDLFIDYLTTQRMEKLRFQDTLYDMLKHSNLDGFKETLYVLFASIPYNNFTNNTIQNYEGYYASVVYAYLASLGLETITEDSTNKSRIDLTLKLKEKVFIFEFKAVDESSGSALKQITERKYYEKYLSSKEIYLIGIEFSKKERNIVNFAWEKFR